ncbi:MAG TPA: ABC transporter ATP-binding protein [Methylomirabilota bacterium]|jgi:spermidine/putrescine transport system ATP-binding protein|nr:ABC transporter ATP-binding protein [Methylomirabilota bacterium]
MSADAADVRLAHVTKRFGAHTAVDDVSLEVRPGEFVSLLGPSGCGKTTTLRILAGFLEPTAGEVSIGGQPMRGIPPYRRPVNMVFQHYALFPHLTVADNIAYGPRRRGVGKAEIARGVAESLELVSLQGLGHRYPRELSGGQQQRVALARALVNRPRVLLLDEPLGALDLKLRRQMQMELKRLQEYLRITSIYVTHDQEEALVLSDRIAVMNAGRVEQMDAARAVYERPATPFVADFIGQTNLLACTVEAIEGPRLRLRCGGLPLLAALPALAPAPGTRVQLSLRPERIALHAERPALDNAFRATVSRRVYLGVLTNFHVTVAAELALVLTTSDQSLAARIEPSSQPWIGWNAGEERLL